MPARKTTPNPERLTISLDASERDKLEQLAQETDRSLAWHVREALRQYLLAQARESREPGKAD
jgi:predicted transcriptional regulator